MSGERMTTWEVLQKMSGMSWEEIMDMAGMESLVKTFILLGMLCAWTFWVILKGMWDRRND